MWDHGTTKGLGSRLLLAGALQVVDERAGLAQLLLQLLRVLRTQVRDESSTPPRSGGPSAGKCAKPARDICQQKAAHNRAVGISTALAVTMLRIAFARCPKRSVERVSAALNCAGEAHTAADAACKARRAARRWKGGRRVSEERCACCRGCWALDQKQ